MHIVAIVEGHGEIVAVPILLRRYFESCLLYDVKIDTIRAHKATIEAAYNLYKGIGIEYYVKLARQNDPDAILVILDADKTCIDRERQKLPSLGPWLEQRAIRACADRPTRVVVANREYEAWFLNAWHLMYPGQNMEPLTGVEALPGCKRKVGELLGEPYEPRIHQPRLTSRLPFDAVLSSTSRSYRRLLKVLDEFATT